MATPRQRFNFLPGPALAQTSETFAAFAQVACASGNPASVHQSGQAARRHIEAASRAVAQWLGLAAPSTTLYVGSTFEALLMLAGGLCADPKPADPRHPVLYLFGHGADDGPLRAAAKALGATLVAVPAAEAFTAAPPPALVAGTFARIVVDAAHPSGALANLGPQSPWAPLLARTPWALNLGLAAPLWPGLQHDLAAPPDAVVLTGQHVGGPEGAICVNLAAGTRVLPLWHGGGQQGGLRPGTEPKEAAAGLAAALMALPSPDRFVALVPHVAKLVAAAGVAASTCPLGREISWLSHVMSLHLRPNQAQAWQRALWRRRMAVGVGACVCGGETLRIALAPDRPQDALPLAHALQDLCKTEFSCASHPP